MNANLWTQLLIAIVPALITGVGSLIIAIKKCKNEINTLETNNKHEIEKLMKQHKIDIEALNEKHRLDIETKEKEHQLKIEEIKVQNEQKINTAEAEAKVRELQSKSVTEKSLEQLKLEIQREMIQKWNRYSTSVYIR